MRQYLKLSVLSISLTALLFGGVNFSYFQEKLRKPSASKSLTSVEAVRANDWQAHTLSIPDLGIEAPIIFPKQKTEPAFQHALRSGVAHYPQTALPGEVGNMYVFGHSSDLPWNQGDYKTVFAKLPEIEQGAWIIITDKDAQPHIYQVTGTAVVHPEDIQVLKDHGGRRTTLTVQTSYPLGTALRRYLVFAEIMQ